jgi:hypothetical protein
MARFPSISVVDSCREMAASIADDVQRFIDGRRWASANDGASLRRGSADDQGAPLVNVLVDRCHTQGYLAHGIALSPALVSGARSINDAVERLAYGRDWGAVRRRSRRKATSFTRDALTHRRGARSTRSHQG